MLPVVISYANFGYLDFVVNLLKNVQDVLKNHRFILYCVDRELFDAVQSYSSDRIEIVLYERNVSKNFGNYGTQTFNEITRVKIELITEAVVKYGFIHFIDGDVVFCKEPTEEYYSNYVDYDIVYQRDAPPPNEPYHEWTCLGNFILRNSGPTIQLLNTIHLYQGRYPNLNDEECQREIFRDAKVTDIRKFPNVKLTEFPMEEFTCGYCITHSLVDPVNIIVFHANHVRGKEAKIDLLKQVGRWYLKDL
jgi:hypothetical protein